MFFALNSFDLCCKLVERGIFAGGTQAEGVFFSKIARLAVNTVFLQYLDFLF